jgi:hypothetical protein
MENHTEVEKKPIYKRKWFLITVGIIVVIILLPKGNSDQNKKVSEQSVTENTSSKDSKTENVKEDTTPKVSTLETRLTKEIEEIKKGIDFSVYRGEILKLQIETSMFKLWGDLIKEGLNSSNPVEVKLSNELQKLVSKVQQKELPLIRKDYIEIVRQKLWEENIKVSGSGRGTTTINLSGGTFFSNKNKSEVQKTLSDILTNFRFKESTYRAYESQDEYTSYTMETLKDNELY